MHLKLVQCFTFQTTATGNSLAAGTRVQVDPLGDLSEDCRPALQHLVLQGHTPCWLQLFAIGIDTTVKGSTKFHNYRPHPDPIEPFTDHDEHLWLLSRSDSTDCMAESSKTTSEEFPSWLQKILLTRWPWHQLGFAWFCQMLESGRAPPASPGTQNQKPVRISVPRSLALHASSVESCFSISLAYSSFTFACIPCEGCPQVTRTTPL